MCIVSTEQSLIKIIGILLFIIEIMFIGSDTLTSIICRRNAIEKLSAYNPLDVDHYHYISADNPRGSDTSGVAKVMGYYGWKYDGTVCWPAKKERTAITEFWGNPKDWDGGKLNAGLVILMI